MGLCQHDLATSIIFHEHYMTQSELKYPKERLWGTCRRGATFRKGEEEGRKTGLRYADAPSTRPNNSLRALTRSNDNKGFPWKRCLQRQGKHASIREKSVKRPTSSQHAPSTRECISQSALLQSQPSTPATSRQFLERASFFA